MISYLRGTLFRQYEDRCVVLAGGVGYEVMLPPIVRQGLIEKAAGDDGASVEFHVLFVQSERQPRPLLIGFSNEFEREFFERFVTVEGIGPAAALKAFTLPIAAIAQAIEGRDAASLRRLSGIGARTAEKIIASLNGRVGKFCLMQEGEPSTTAPGASPQLRQEVERVLVQQMGYKVLDAHRMVSEALKRRPEIENAEDLFEEVYRGRRLAL